MVDERGAAIRARVLTQLARSFTAIALPHPIRVAIDGRTAAGKTTLAIEDHYLAMIRPRERADIVIDNMNPTEPRLRYRLPSVAVLE